MNNPKFLEKTSLGYIRVLHAIPGAPNVDVYADDKLIAKNVTYGSFTDYIHLNEGNYKITLYSAGDKSSPLLTNTLSINNVDIFTVAACGTLSSMGLLAIADSNMPSGAINPLLRFAHLSPDMPAVDITLPNGFPIFRNISFKQVTLYLPLSPLNVTLQIRLAGTSTVVLTMPNVELEASKIYTIYAIGLVDGTPELQSLLIEDSTML